MNYSKLGSSGLEVSRVCLGTMTWGTQNTQQDANQQLDYALEQGINFIDTAEVYSIPPKPESFGKTETIIGNWLASNAGKRDEIILATKIAGIGFPWIRDGGPITGDEVIKAVDNSLKRLQTDYIDVYQLHWVNRTNPHFGNHWPNQIDYTETDANLERESMLDILQGLDNCINAGKIRYAGLSDDTPWGISEFIRLSEQHNLPRVTSIQNEFGLLQAKDSPYVIETCVMEDIAYLPWSPLGGGVLSGKYLDGARPEASRWTLDQRMGLFRDTEQTANAVRAYIKLAEEHNMTAPQLGLLWCDQCIGVTSTIIGATTMSQLKENIDAFDLNYSEALAERVDEIIRKYPAPF